MPHPTIESSIAAETVAVPRRRRSGGARRSRARVQIEPSSRNRPQLYTEQIRPGGRVLFSCDPAVGRRVRVEFDKKKSPLRGVGRSFWLQPGAPVEFRIRQGAQGDYVFHIIVARKRGPDLMLAVAADGTIRKTGFSVGSDGRRRQQYFLRGTGDPFDLLVQNHGEKDQTVELRTPSGDGQEVKIHGGDSQVIPCRMEGFGRNLTVTPKGLPDQSGGTEQIEIIVEPV